MNLVIYKIRKLLRLYLIPSGRIDRLTFFLGTAVLWGLVIVSSMGIFIYSHGTLSGFTSVAQWHAFFGMFVAALCVAAYADIVLKIKRLRDMGRTPWHILWLSLIVILQNLFTLISGSIAEGIVALLYVVEFGALFWMIFSPSRTLIPDIIEVFS